MFVTQGSPGRHHEVTREPRRFVTMKSPERRRGVIGETPGCHQGVTRKVTRGSPKRHQGVNRHVVMA